MDADLKEPQKKLESAVEFFKKEIQTLRTGRPSLSLLENVKISYYGNPSSVDKVASLNIMDNRIIVISPWDMKMIPEIEKAIMAANIGLTPQNDGKVIRIAVPPMTEERRKQMVKLLKKMAEDAKIAIRNIRRDGNDELKKKKSDGLIQEDRLNKLQDELQKITDQTVQKVDDLTPKKEQEIMTT